MNKKIIIILLAFLLIPLITAGGFSIEFKPHYFKEGREVIWTPDVDISSISFEVLGVNHNSQSRILNLTIIDSYPLEFKNSLPKTMKELRILQSNKILWTSKIINLDDFNYSSIDFWIGVEGVLESTNEVIYVEEHFNVTLIIPEENENFISSFGNKIWEDSPIKGILLIVGGVVIGGFLVWRYSLSDKLDGWREKSERRRIKKRRNEG